MARILKNMISIIVGGIITVKVSGNNIYNKEVRKNGDWV